MLVSLLLCFTILLTPFYSYAQAQQYDTTAPILRGLVAGYIPRQNFMFGPKWYDITGRFHGTLTNMDTTSTTSGWRTTTRVGGIGEIVFDGTNDYVVVPASSALYPPAFSMTFWIKRSGSGGPYQGLTSNSAGDYARAIEVRLNGGLNISILTTGFTCCYTDFDSGPITAGVWHHLVWTYSIDAGMNVWFNCTTNLASMASSGTAWAINQDLILGNVSPSAGDRYNGAMSDVLLYNRVLTQAEACQIMQDTRSGKGSVRVNSTSALGFISTFLKSGFFHLFKP